MHQDSIGRFLRNGVPALVVLAISAFSAPAWSLADVDPLADVVHADLIAENDAVAPGSAVTLGLRLRHAPHWHTYWIVPGDAGLPTQLRWHLEPGYSAGPILWPVPQKLRVGALANYGYEGEVLLPVVVQVPDSVPVGGMARFSARADWLVCNDLCIPGGADLTLNLPVHAATSIAPGPEAALFAATRLQLPAARPPAGLRATAEAARIRLELAGAPPVRKALEFFPLEGGRIVAAADQALGHGPGAQVHLDLSPVIPAEAGFTALRGVLVADGGPGGGGWISQVDLPLHRTAAASWLADTVTPAKPAALAPLGTGATTAGATPLAAGQGGAVNAVAGGTTHAEPRTDAPPPTAALAPANAAQANGTAPAPTAFAPLEAVIALAGALLGGLILNLMPCVFPVLSLKLIALVQHRGETRARLRAHGLAFTVGAVLSFLVLAGLLLVLRSAGSQIGWGFQLQSPLVVAGLIALFFLIGLNLLGAVDFTLGAGLANSRAARALDGGDGAAASDGGLRGSFATGVLAAVVASPCTAPFMGAALGYAVTQSAPMALLVFAALGAGMALPYLVLTFFPAGLARLPRPGPWMERLKQFMAFPMFLTCVWLFWVLGLQVGMNNGAWMLVALVGLALFAWSAGLAQRGNRGFRWLAAVAVVVAALSLIPLARDTALPALPAAQAAQAGQAAQATGDAWSAWSPEAQRAALAGGHPVFVDFTAAWCITCQANRRLVLADERVERALHAAGVVRMEADWTRRDETISRELARYARSGVPMYVLYDRSGTGHLLPEILSTQGLLDAIAAI